MTPHPGAANNWGGRGQKKIEDTGLKREIGSHFVEREVAYYIGRQTPLGDEFNTVMKMIFFWPDLPMRDAFGDFLKGLEERSN